MGLGHCKPAACARRDSTGGRQHCPARASERTSVSFPVATSKTNPRTLSVSGTNGLSRMRRRWVRASSSRSGKASECQLGRVPTSCSIAARDSSSVTSPPAVRRRAPRPRADRARGRRRGGRPCRRQRRGVLPAEAAAGAETADRERKSPRPVSPFQSAKDWPGSSVPSPLRSPCSSRTAAAKSASGSSPSARRCTQFDPPGLRCSCDDELGQAPLMRAPSRSGDVGVHTERRSPRPSPELPRD